MVILQPKQYFLDRIRHADSGCWIWIIRKNAHGYGVIHNSLAHRCCWASLVGPIPDGMCVLHKCDTPACINPAHLYIGTQLQNIQDRTDRGRSNKGQRWKQKNPKPRSTICMRGHPLNGNKWGCAICHRMRSANRYRRMHGKSPLY